MINSVGIAVFDGFERLDVEGPLCVLSWTARLAATPLTIQLLSVRGQAVADHLLDRSYSVDGATSDTGGFDLLIVPGGDPNEFGNDPALVGEIARLASGSARVASVCTGAFLIAEAGLANGRTMTTHSQFRAAFQHRFPRVTLSNERFERDGALWSSAGISAGIDMALRLVMDVWSDDVARRVQIAMEYYPEPIFDRTNS
jgi:transcriptional regulator GlxA family with amidase domain